jgi:hypothetical protein
MPEENLVQAKRTRRPESMRPQQSLTAEAQSSGVRSRYNRMRSVFWMPVSS